MKFKKTLILFVVLVFLLLIAYLLERPRGTIQPLSLFPDFTIDAASLIHIHNRGNKDEAPVTLVKSGQDWKIENEQGFPADSELVKKALESISELKKANNVVSQNPENQKLYEVDPNQGIEVKVSDAKKKNLANFFVGKTGPDFMSTYIRKADSNEVLLCEGYHLRSAFSRTAKNWYDLNICKFTPEEITKIEIAEAGRKLTLKKDKENWQLIDPNQQQARAKKNLADDMANTLSRLRAIDLLRAEPDKLAEYQLNPPARQLTVFLTDGTDKKISIGKKNDQNQYYVKAEKDVIYLVAQYHVDRLNKSFEELKELPPQADPNNTKQPTAENPAATGEGKTSDAEGKPQDGSAASTTAASTGSVAGQTSFGTGEPTAAKTPPAVAAPQAPVKGKAK